MGFKSVDRIFHIKDPSGAHSMSVANVQRENIGDICEAYGKMCFSENRDRNYGGCPKFELLRECFFEKRFGISFTAPFICGYGGEKRETENIKRIAYASTNKK